MAHCLDVRILFLISFGIALNFLKFAYANLYDTKAVEIYISNGKIRGEYGYLDGDNYVVFTGIPYAAPPVGNNRFQIPGKPADWRGVMNATKLRSCLQNDENKKDIFIQIRKRGKPAEDCLFLSVFAPPTVSSLTATDKKRSTGYSWLAMCSPSDCRCVCKLINVSYPVMVWIHGGGFQTGSAADYPQDPILRNFVKQKIIFVTFNYRLGPLGFASTGDSLMPGNYGLWDQIEALTWIQENIAAFGGDPHSVTLIGQGSGAASASILALSPRAEGLFHRTILLSGTAISPGVIRETAINATKALDLHLKCASSGNSSKILKCLRDERLAKQLTDPERPRTFYDDYYEFVPIVDGYTGVIPDYPERLASYRPRVPTIIGTTRDETVLHFLIVGRENLNLSALTAAQSESLVRNLTSEYAGFINHELITKGCYYEYVHSRDDPGAEDDVLKDGLLQLYSHFWYHAPASRLASYYEEKNVPVYLYSFDHPVETTDGQQCKLSRKYFGYSYHENLVKKSFLN